MSFSRRDFLNAITGASAAAVIPARWVTASELSPGSKPKLRFAVASDLHYGQRNTPFDEMTGDLVRWINAEKKHKGLDALFLNGDLTNDSPPLLLHLRDKHLVHLQVPYHCIKGNHDFLDPAPDSPTASWEKIWGYPANHSFKMGDFAFVLCDTTAPAESSVYLAADIDWLKRQLEAHKDAPGIFVMIHIQQRAHRVDGWPQHGLKEPAEQVKGEAVMALLEATPNVVAVFHGHNHHQTGVYVSGEKQYFFDSHAGGSWGAKRGYRMVEVYEDHRMLTYQVDGEDGAELNRNELGAASG